MDRLIVGLREALNEEPESLTVVRGTLSKSGRDQARVVVRNEYGMLFASVEADDEDDEEDVDDDAEEGDEGDGVRKKGRRGLIEIPADQPLLAVRLVLHDPRRPSFEPQIQYAILSEWTVGKGPWIPDRRFVLAGYMLRRVPKALAGVSAPGRLTTTAAVKKVLGARKGEDRRLSCLLPLGVDTVPLYTLDRPEEVERLASSMKSMWSRVVEEGAQT